MTAETLDTLFRGIALGGFLATALVLVINGKTNRVVWLGLVFYVCAIAHVLDNLTGLRGQDLQGFDALSFMQNSTTSLLWAFLLNVFDDTKGRFWRRLVPVGVITTLNLVAIIQPAIAPFHWVFYHSASIIMMAHLIYVMMRGIQTDLIEARRQLRAPLLFLVAGYIVFMAWADYTRDICCDPISSLNVFQAGYLAAMALGSCIGFLNAGPVFWGSRVSESSQLTSAQSEPTDGVELVLLNRLKTAMDSKEIWKREGLSIGALAHELTVPEYRLRRLINERLGYKNFADYINSHRISAAKAILCDPDRATHSVSQIAFELGFGSLGPFNRAFRLDTELSPSEWRTKTLANS
jgi:AraC-like DNA-binding protein